MLGDIERMNELAADGQLSEEDIAELTDMISAAAAERAREDTENSDYEADTFRTERRDEEATQRQDLTDVDAT
jgi:multidrug resistance efflux pump